MKRYISPKIWWQSLCGFNSKLVSPQREWFGVFQRENDSANGHNIGLGDESGNVRTQIY